MSREELVAAIGEVARRLPPGQVAALAEVLEDCETPTTEARSRAVGAVASPTFADLAGRLVSAWEHEDIRGSALAIALEAATQAVRKEQEEESIEVVWTGPRTTVVPVRLTREVLIDVIRAARDSLFIVSFAAYKVDVVLSELTSAVERGVVIRLILETEEASGGALTFDAAKAFETVRERVTLYVWPTVKRPLLERGQAKLHAKAALADDHTVFVTSANLTGLGITENMELGLLVRGGPTPRRLSEHFRELIADGTLVEVIQ